MTHRLSDDEAAAIRIHAAGLDMQITDLTLPGVDPETDGFSLAYLGDGEPLSEGCDELTLGDIVVAVAYYVAHIEVPRLRESENDMVITHYRDNRPSLLVWESEALSDGGTEGSHKYRCALRREVSDEPMVFFVVDLTNVWNKVSLNRS